MVRPLDSGEWAREGIYNFIVGYKRAHGGASPTIREIQSGVDLKSTSSIIHHLRMLERQGRIVLAHGRSFSRSIAIPGERWFAPNE